MKLSCFYPLAICQQPCQHGGTCIGPSVCNCKKLIDTSIINFSISYFYLFTGLDGYTGSVCQERMC